MSDSPNPSSLPSRLVRFMENPLARLLFFALTAIAAGQLMEVLLPFPPLKPDAALAVTGMELWLRALRSVVPVVFAYWLMVRVMERRKVHELRPAKLPAHVLVGWLVGMGVLLLAAAAMAAFGAYRIQGINEGVYLLGPFVVLGLLPGITEEIIARGILFRVVEDGFGTWIALGISALAFGAGHAANPNATLWSSAAIAIEAGLLLGMAYAWTRSLWFVMALHAAWNFTQGPLLGIPVSGIENKGLLQSTTQGHGLISGGSFGAEASILTVVICVSAAAWFARRAITAGRIKKPSWRSARTYLILLALLAVAGAGLLMSPLAPERAIPLIVVLAFAVLLGATPALARGAPHATEEPLP